MERRAAIWKMERSAAAVPAGGEHSGSVGGSARRRGRTAAETRRKEGEKGEALTMNRARGSAEAEEAAGDKQQPRVEDVVARVLEAAGGPGALMLRSNRT